MSLCYWLKHSKKLWAWERKQEMPFAYLTPTPFWPILICSTIIWVTLGSFPCSFLLLHCLITCSFLISLWPSPTGFVDHWIIILEVGWRLVGYYVQMFTPGVSRQVSVGCVRSQGIVDAAKCISSAFKCSSSLELWIHVIMLNSK